MKKNKIKIMFVEDEAPFREILIDKLKKEGFETISGSNGKEGLEKAISQMPDLILLDIKMPVMDGLAMLQELRKTNKYGQNVPVVLLTVLSATSENIIETLAKTDPLFYLVKSDVTMNQVVDKIKEVLKLKYNYATK